MMKLIAGPRQSGKTTKLLLLAEETGWTYIAPTSTMEHAALNISKRIGIDPKVCAVKSYIGGPCVIDEVQYLISRLSNINLSDIMAIGALGIVGKDYDEKRDWLQYEEFKKIRPELTYRDFVEFKYGEHND